MAYGGTWLPLCLPRQATLVTFEDAQIYVALQQELN